MKRKLVGYAATFVVLNVADILITYYILERGLGMEGNSILRGIMSLPTLSVVGIKAFGSMLIACILLLLPRHLARQQQWILRTIVIAMIGIVTFNVIIVIGGLFI